MLAVQGYGEGRVKRNSRAHMHDFHKCPSVHCMHEGPLALTGCGERGENLAGLPTGWLMPECLTTPGRMEGQYDAEPFRKRLVFRTGEAKVPTASPRAHE